MIPILYSFRRCPYAMRARLALVASGIQVELREILLRDKAPEFLAVSPSATVPCLKDRDVVLDESLEIMDWALAQRDPLGWLDMPARGRDLIAEADGPFKLALDRTKYWTRYDCDPEESRLEANAFLTKLDTELDGNSWLFGDQPSLADMAILPFVRQFAFVDKARFDREEGAAVRAWLEAFLASGIFQTIMPKYAVWQAGDPVVNFPGAAG